MVERDTDLSESVIEPKVGLVLTHSRRFTDDEVREFATLSGHPVDVLPEHLPSLLVIAPLTKLGGDLNYLSARMEWTVERPVRRDEEVTAELEVTGLEQTEKMQKISFDARILCGSEVVVRGRSQGVILGS